MKLSPISKTDHEQIKNLVNTYSVMKFIGDKKIWNKEKLANFFIYNLREQKLPNDEREYFYYKMSEIKKKEEVFIGIIGFYLKKDKYNLTVFIKPSQQKKGYFREGLKMIMEKLKEYKNVDHIYSQVHADNDKMNKIMKDNYFFNKSFNIGPIKVNEYIIYNRKYTWFAKSDYIPISTFETVFDSRKGRWEKWDPSKSPNPDFIHLDGEHYFDRNNEKYNVLLKNIANNSRNPAIEKSTLFMALKRKFPEADYLPTTYFYNPEKDDYNKYKDIFKENKPWILKPDGGFSGKDITILTDFKQLKKLKKSIWSVQEYIQNPLLIDKRKFHIRVIFIRRDDGKGFMFKLMPIYLSKKEFKLFDYEDHDIHISHFSKEQNELYFNLDYVDFGISEEKINKLQAKIKNILKDINSVINLGCYSETKRCYEMYGADFMITSNMEVKLIEFNRKIGLKEFSNAEVSFNYLLLNAEMDITCDYYFSTPSDRMIFEYLSFVEC